MTPSPAHLYMTRRMSAPSVSLRVPAANGRLPLPRRYWAIVASALAIAMSVLDSTIVNIALPLDRARLRRHAAHRSGSSMPTSWRSWSCCCRLPRSGKSSATGAFPGRAAVFRSPRSLRVCAHPAHPQYRARHPRPRGGGHHERERRAGALQLTRSATSARRRHQRVLVATSAALGPTHRLGGAGGGQWRWLFGITFRWA